MEVVEACSALLSNREVLELLKKNSSKRHTNMATILYETSSYLESSPVTNYSVPDLGEFLDLLKEKNYELTRLEKIQLANLAPQSDTELHLIIDNIEERFSEEQRADLLKMINSFLIESSSYKSRKKVRK